MAGALRGWKRMSRITSTPKSSRQQPRPICAISRSSSDYPDPDLAVEVDISRPAIIVRDLRSPQSRGSVAVYVTDCRYRAVDGGREYVATETSGFLPVGVADIQRWLFDEYTKDHSAWLRKLRAEIRKRAAKQSKRRRSK